MLIPRHHHSWIPACPLPHISQHSRLCPSPGHPRLQVFPGEPLLKQPRVSDQALPLAPQAKTLCPSLPSSPSRVCSPCPPLCPQHWLCGQQTPCSWASCGHREGSIPLPWQQRLGGVPPSSSPLQGAPIPFPNPNPPLNPTQSHPHFGLCPHKGEARGWVWAWGTQRARQWPCLCGGWCDPGQGGSPGTAVTVYPGCKVSQ